MRTAIILTTYNRPKLVRDAIASVLEQKDQDWRLYIMDDGSNDTARDAIADAIDGHRFDLVKDAEVASEHWHSRIVWYQGPDRSAVERKRTISYSRSINLALNCLLREESLVAYVCDDDYLYPEAIGARADYLQAHPAIHVVWGRSRSVEYDTAGFNKWGSPDAPVPGRSYPRPTGRRELLHNGGAAKTYFVKGERDPATGLDYVEEAFWQSGDWWYGRPFHHDHNQVMHRRECLETCRPVWFGEADAGGTQYWGEDLKTWAVGDKAFFTLLGQVHPFRAVDAWCVTKRYHSGSDGVQTGPVRE